MPKSIVSLIDWYGPYSLTEACQASFDYDDGIYMAIGKCKYEKNTKLQYAGLASTLSQRLNGQHHKLSKISQELEIWLGEVASPRTPGKKMKVTDRLLDLSEWAHVYFLQLPLNEKKKSSPPPYQIVVYNRWWKTDFITPRKKRPHEDWPDLIDFVDSATLAKLVWFGGGQIIKPADEFKG